MDNFLLQKMKKEMIIVIFLGLIFSCKSNKNAELLEKNEPKIIRSLTIFVPGDPKICKCTIGEDTSVKLSEKLLPPAEEVKKLNIKTNIPQPKL